MLMCRLLPHGRANSLISKPRIKSSTGCASPTSCAELTSQGKQKWIGGQVNIATACLETRWVGSSYQLTWKVAHSEGHPTHLFFVF